jgi:hypothetical protein
MPLSRLSNAINTKKQNVYQHLQKLNGFPHPTIVPINGIPTYKSMAEITHQLTSANAASVQSKLGDHGPLGLLHLTVSSAEYNTLSALALVPATNPVAESVIPRRSTLPQSSAIIQQYTNNISLFKEYLATDKALKQQVKGAINTMHLRTLGHCNTRFANITT